jgi:hypothetical protein
MCLFTRRTMDCFFVDETIMNGYYVYYMFLSTRSWIYICYNMVYCKRVVQLRAFIQKGIFFSEWVIYVTKSCLNWTKFLIFNRWFHYLIYIYIYIPLAEINGAPHFFDYSSMLHSFDLKFLPQMHLWLLNIPWKFQPYRMRICWEMYKNVSCAHGSL